MSGRALYQLQVILHLLARAGSAPERLPATDVMRRAIIRTYARGLRWSATIVMVRDIERASALGRGRGEDVTLFYPTTHEYRRREVMRMIIQFRLSQVWSICVNECGVCVFLRMLGVLSWLLCAQWLWIMCG